MPTGVYKQSQKQIENRVKSFVGNGKTANEKHWNWKSNEVGYSALHRWLRDRYGKATGCAFKDRTCAGPSHWANKSGAYKRDLNDWLHLCQSHHLRHDGRKPRLTVDDVKQIREDYVNKINSQRGLARKYGVSNMTIYNIVHRRKWGYVQ